MSPPLGIAAVVLARLSSRRIAASHGTLNGKATAHAATIIACVQMLLLLVVVILGWDLLGGILHDFPRDPLVQRVFREADANATLHYSSAREEEITARTLITQIVAMQDQYRRRTGQGYLCNLGLLLQLGIEGASPAEKRAFAEHLHQSAYIFELHDCPSENGQPAASYKLTAVPRSPRMPPGAMLFCADSTGVVKQINGETSLDCYEHGYVLLNLPRLPRKILLLNLRPFLPNNPPAPAFPRRKLLAAPTCSSCAPPGPLRRCCGISSLHPTPACWSGVSLPLRQTRSSPSSGCPKSSRRGRSYFTNKAYTTSASPPTR